MEFKDLISGFAAIVGLAALVLSLLNRQDASRNRREDLARQEAFQLRVRVWEILHGEPGFRSVQALESHDGETAKRIMLLKRTAEQLKLAGAPELATKLQGVLDCPWPQADAKARQSRDEFGVAAAKFLTPA